jgi:hypothetical protein
LDDDAQGVLVPMTEAELKDAGRLLTRKVKELRDLQAEHAEARADMKRERDELAAEIDAIASTIRTQGR